MLINGDGSRQGSASTGYCINLFQSKLTRKFSSKRLQRFDFVRHTVSFW